MLVYFIRHGESETNVKKLYGGQFDAPLTENGIAQAEKLREKLAGIKFDRVYSSDLSRAVTTARTALPGVEPIQDARLRESALGWITGKPPKEIRENNPDKVELLNKRDFRVFGGECVADVTRRTAEFITELSHESIDTAAVFCHGGVIIAALGHLLDMEIPHAKVSQPNCMVCVFELTEDSFSLVSWNKF